MIKDSKKVSVIIPVYNCELFLNRCVDSVLNQTYSNIEIILIDDGSKDNSYNICENYKITHNNIKFFSQKNSGVSSARNKGIEIAKGYYIMFLDSDDYLNYDYVENMVYVIEKYNADTVISNYTIDLNDKKTVFNIPKKILNRVDISFPKCIDYYFTDYFLCSCWKTLYKKEKISKLRFNKKLKYGEDFLFSICNYMNSLKTIFTNNSGYHYFINNSSAMHVKTVDNIIRAADDNLIIYNLLKQKLLEINFNNKVDLLIDLTIKNYINRINDLFSYSDKTTFFKKIIELNKKYKTIINIYQMNTSKLQFKYKLEFMMLKYSVNAYYNYLFIKKNFIKKNLQNIIRRKEH